MAIEVIEDLIDGAEINGGIFDPPVHQRVLLVRGLDKNPASSLLQRAWDNCGAQISQEHPTVRADSGADINEKLIVHSYRVVPVMNARDKARVFLTYRYGGWVIRYNGNVIRDTTKLDYMGRLLLTKYKEGATGTTNGDYPANGLGMYGEAPVFRPGDTVEFDGISESSSQDLNAVYRGSINSKDWQGEKRHSWLCTGIVSRGYATRSVSRPAFYSVRYCFAYRGQSNSVAFDDSWDPVLIYQNPQTRRAPIDINIVGEGFKGGGLPAAGDADNSPRTGNGWKQWQLYREVDFNEIGLPWL